MVGNVCVVYNHRSSDEHMGRFGGGWKWKFGFQSGGRTLLLNLLFCTVRFDLLSTEEACRMAENLKREF